ncbi:hypothetical protein C5B42_05945 [Candidatus Cerribacteria bacterium 'Amazon FNV 2010 28 9']|uniref:DUF559 domain-containing protein n=1 Tax=Candidatus Cerribacteria bacterium 'Amazon FNV 2010 28 9' TaxID=2081795 RepID=A0A317JLR9_9BACT|nr:MAG: hypothetical protein C5B42_05945 [Candidatus Cerribacteria bacterium 'Amazon FNV 2010 28 9']
MSTTFNSPYLKTIRQKLRNNRPKAEITLWYYLKNRQLHGYKFRRQHSMARFVFDFYCPEKRIAIELDGETHYNDDQFKRDIEKKAFATAFGIKVLRFTNEDVHTNLEGVLESISQALSPPLSPLLQEEGKLDQKTKS